MPGGAAAAAGNGKREKWTAILLRNWIKKI